MGDKSTLVLFYNSDCGHSRNMLSDWEQAKQQLQQSGQVDCIMFEDQKIMRKYGIIGLPTVKFFPNGLDGPNSIEYKGDRTANSLISFGLLEKSKFKDESITRQKDLTIDFDGIPSKSLNIDQNHVDILVKKINKAILEKGNVKVLNLDIKPSQQVQEILNLSYKTKGWSIQFREYASVNKTFMYIFIM